MKTTKHTRQQSIQDSTATQATRRKGQQSIQDSTARKTAQQARHHSHQCNCEDHAGLNPTCHTLTLTSTRILGIAAAWSLEAPYGFYSSLRHWVFSSPSPTLPCSHIQCRTLTLTECATWVLVFLGQQLSLYVHTPSQRQHGSEGNR